MTKPPHTELDPAATVGDALWQQVQQLTDDLRRSGVDVALSEVLDAAEALTHVDIGDRRQLRAALRSLLVKDADHDERFAAAFDRHFPAHLVDPVRADGDAGRPSEPSAGADEEVGLPDDPTTHALADGSEHDLRLLAAQLVDEHGGFGETARTERYHVYRVLRAADLEALLRAAMDRARTQDDPPSRAELQERIEALRRLVAEQVRARLAVEQLESSSSTTMSPFDLEFAQASAQQLVEIRATVRPLARRLASKLRRRRSLATGRVDMRRTARRSVVTGGVPFDVAYRRQKVHKPELFTLCDVSGSVADFAGFTLTLVAALSDELADTRSFAFVDAIDEITAMVERCPMVIEPWQLLQHGRVIGASGHSDYGTVLESFWRRYGEACLTSRSTVMISGDARSNYRPPGEEVLARIAERVRAVYWLNPEPHAEWHSTDSMLASYAPHCNDVFEVRTTRQLANAIEAIL